MSLFLHRICQPFKCSPWISERCLVNNSIYKARITFASQLTSLQSRNHNSRITDSTRDCISLDFFQFGDQCRGCQVPTCVGPDN